MNFGKGGEKSHHRSKCDLFLKLVTEASEEGVDMQPFFNVITKLLEFIIDVLDLLIENGDRGVSLGDGTQLDMEIIDVIIAIILEELLKRLSKLASGGIIIGDEIEELGGYARIFPLDDCEIVLHPSWIASLQGRGQINLILNTTATKVNMNMWRQW
jgi:hypothetical protein